MSLLLPQFRYDKPEEDREEIATRLAEALQGDRAGSFDDMPIDEEQVEIECGHDLLRPRAAAGDGFREMTTAELAETKKAIANLRLPIMEVPTRRFGADSPRPPRRHARDPARQPAQCRRHPAQIEVAEVPASAAGDPLRHFGLDERYSRMALHFVHAITNDRDRVAYLPVRDPAHQHHPGPPAPRRRCCAGPDRIPCEGLVGRNADRTLPARFQREMGAAGLGQGAVVLLITDGLDREGVEGLEDEMIRLQKSLPATDLAKPPAALRCLSAAEPGAPRP